MYIANYLTMQHIFCWSHMRDKQTWREQCCRVLLTHPQLLLTTELHPSSQRNVWYVPLPRCQGLGALDHLRRFGAFKSCLSMGLSVDRVDENSTLWRPCFLLVQLRALKIDTRPWLIIDQVTPFSWPVDWSPWWVLSHSSYRVWWTLVAHLLSPHPPSIIVVSTVLC